MILNLRRCLALALASLPVLAACDDHGTDPRPDPLSPPTGVSAVATGPTSIRVSWQLVPGAAAYELDRAAATGEFTPLRGDLTQTFVEDTGLATATEYRYRVRARSGSRTTANSAEVSATTGAAAPSVRIVSGVTGNETWHADTLYVLRGYVQVTNGSTLTIEPGTTIVGDTATKGSSLWVLRGSRLVAEGTAEAPIVFTSQHLPGARAPGDWGGIVIVGNAPMNRTGGVILTEGPSDAQVNYAGGTDWEDDSGSLRYVRIEFAGYDITGTGQELNGLSSYAVGSGTTYEYVQTIAGLDDSFEFWGGAVDLRHVVSYESGDDHFDWTEGYRGRGQYLVALQTSRIPPRPGTGGLSSDPRGFEGDGCDPSTSGCVVTSAPFSQPVFANFTVIGPGELAGFPANNAGAHVRRGSAGSFVNGILGRWPGTGVEVQDAATRAMLDADSLTFRALVLADNGSNFQAADTAGGARHGSVLSDSAAAWGIRTADLASIFPSLPTSTTPPGAVDWRPAAGSAAAIGGLASFAGTAIAGRVHDFFGGSLAGTGYVGAADPAGEAWWDGWTAYHRN